MEIRSLTSFPRHRHGTQRAGVPVHVPGNTRPEGDQTGAPSLINRYKTTLEACAGILRETGLFSGGSWVIQPVAGEERLANTKWAGWRLEYTQSHERHSFQNESQPIRIREAPATRKTPFSNLVMDIVKRFK